MDATGTCAARRRGLWREIATPTNRINAIGAGDSRGPASRMATNAEAHSTTVTAAAAALA